MRLHNGPLHLPTTTLYPQPTTKEYNGKHHEHSPKTHTLSSTSDQFPPYHHRSTSSKASRHQTILHIGRAFLTARVEKQSKKSDTQRKTQTPGMADSKPVPTPDSKAKTNSAPARPYLSNGQMLDNPPFSARINSLINSAYNITGLYITSLFSLDAYTAAQNSSFNTHGPGRNGGSGSGGGRTTGSTGSSWFGRGGGGAGSGSGSGSGSGGGGPGRRIGRVDDVRAPECGSCR